MADVIIPAAQLYYHDGEEDFPHGAGASPPGWYVYSGKWEEPDGPFQERDTARAYGVAKGWLFHG